MNDDLQQQLAEIKRGQQLNSAGLLLLWIYAIAMSLLFAPSIARGAEPERVATTSDALGWQLADLATLPASDRPHQLYLWIPPYGGPEWIPAINFTVNTAASHSQVIQLGRNIANGWMVVFDLRRLAPKAEQLAKLVTTVDFLALDDPYFHVPQANSKIRAAILAPHLNQQIAAVAASFTASSGRLYRADWFIGKALTTLEGGRYYDFLQIERRPTRIDPSTKKPVAIIPQSAFLASLGVFEETTQSITADQRSAIFRSGVTGKPRRIDVFYGLGRGGNIVSITRDISDEDLDVKQHPIRNLRDFKFTASEVIVERPNGTHAFALFNNKGEFQDEVPPNIARDSTIPAPHTARLQSAISCIRCHGPDDGWKPFGNDVQSILRSGLDVFSDLADARNSREQIIDQLASQYAGDLDGPDGPLGRARRNYLTSTFRITGGPRLGDSDKRSVVAKVSDDIGRIYAQYRYDLVTPEKAALELGVKGKLEDALGPIAPGVLVDPITGTLRAGVSVNRSDWETVFADAMLLAETRRRGE